MSIPALPPVGGQPISSSSAGLPPGPPMSLSSPWVKGLQMLFPNVDPGTLSQYAYAFQQNMLQMVSNACNAMTQKMHEAAQKMKEAIQEQ